MIMQLQLDIYKGVPRKRPHKGQEEYEALAQSHGGIIQRTPTPYRINVSMGTKCNTGSN